MKNKGFTLIELLIVIGVIAILATAVIVIINPQRQFSQARDATRESHLTTLYSSLMSYKVDNLGILDIPNLSEGITEICNTNVYTSVNCENEQLVDLSDIVPTYINQLPIDPQGPDNQYGTGYFIAEGSIILVALKAENRFIGRGISEEEYLKGPGFICGEGLVNFIYNQSEVNYGTVVGQNDTCWMDRNLGASQVATAYNDSQAYGDLFQWGRLDDGHQVRSPAPDNTAILSPNDNPEHPYFITSTEEDDWDWRSPQNDELWKEEYGLINNPCPDGWRVPTETEIQNEINSWDTEISDRRERAYNSDLKWTVAGYRHRNDGSLNFVNSYGIFWTSSVSGTDAKHLYFGSGFSFIDTSDRANGFSVRCIRIN